MQAWLISAPGLENLQLVQNFQIPEPEAHEIRVRVLATGLNPVDYKRCTWSADAWTYPQIPGLDVCGIVDKIGSNVSNFQIGDAVVYHGSLRKKTFGAFAEYTVHDAATAIKLSKPPATKEEAVNYAALPCAGWTAYHACFKKLKLLDTCKQVNHVLVTAGSGGVGGFCIQLIVQLVNKHRKNPISIITTCSASNFEFVKQLGAHHVIDYNTENIVERVQQITNNVGVDAWIDTVSDVSAAQGLQCLAFAGEMVCIVGSPALSASQLFGKAQSLHHVALGAAHANDMYAKQDLVQMGTHMNELLEQGKLDPMVGLVLPLSQLKDGLIKLQNRHVRGKVVVSTQE